MPERFKVVLDHARRYTSARLYLLPFTGTILDSGKGVWPFAIVNNENEAKLLYC